MRFAASIMALSVCTTCFCGGCGLGEDESIYMTPARQENGLVIILPGIEGVSNYNRSIRRGLNESGCRYALMIRPWGRPIPVAGMLLNQMDAVGNRAAAAGVAQTVVRYWQQHPGKPVYMVGHSGGGGIAVFAAEALADQGAAQVDGLVLLSASISNGYDLSKALSRTRQGVVNFYNPQDAALLGIGTTVMGNVDGARGPSAGLQGFSESFPRLFEVAVSGISLDPHGSTTNSKYVMNTVAPWIKSDQWPPSTTAGLP